METVEDNLVRCPIWGDNMYLEKKKSQSENKDWTRLFKV